MLQILQRKMNRKNKKGFTLIELIVVITILGILVAIAVPRFGGFTSDAQDAADKATARTIKSAIVMVEAEGDEVTADNVSAKLDITVLKADAATSDVPWAFQLGANGAIAIYHYNGTASVEITTN